MPDSPSVTSPERNPGPDARRRTVHRSLLFRGLAVVVLIVFVLGIGDCRRKHNGMEHAERYIAALQQRIGDSESLPLNLSPASLDGLPPSGVSFETLSRDEVRSLRSYDEPMIIAWSVSLVQVLSRSGRAVVVFDKGTLEAKWLPETEFRNRRAMQDRDVNVTP